MKQSVQIGLRAQAAAEGDQGLAIIVAFTVEDPVDGVTGQILQDRIVSGVAGAPAGHTALEAVARGLDAAAVMLGEARRDLTAQRQAVIAANPDLQERELAKLATYAAAVAATLRQRGVGELQATLAAEAGMSVLRVAIRQWANGDDGRSLPVVMKASMAELRAVTAGG